jgi:hypothetical protein
MALTETQKATLKDIALGKSITSQLSTDAQIAAVREQIDLILAANPKITICDNYKALTTIVATEKAKKKDATKKDIVIDEKAKS